ncbi:hypothetical protein Poli38472_007876 [Pythium oligandrum]|uniref:Anaphase-promoting complex subunit 5 n=1 Tax=Pythium oligandrum TaxID=41045 RepID=A0A8K1FPB4_PYTOL|nr:hypothetical protein Poli38472_007876 [Pythium oligandrum]|eukprot:TMW68204.1 hypothetical protein Poli38472_007876 [Pythium oligandrum]
MFGVFVRSFVLAVNRLLFDGLSKLYEEIQRYREAELHKTERRSSHDTSELSIPSTSSPSTRFLWHQGDETMDDMQLSSATSSELLPSQAAPGDRLSQSQKQFFLHDTVQLIELGQSVGAMSIRGHSVRPASRTNPDELFVAYLDLVNRREYDAAVEALHAYHDVALAATRRLRQALRGRSEAAANGTTGAPGTSGLHFLGSGVQYAALNLAGLHILFDRYEVAADSLHEAIRVAQHHGDHICVAFALSWLIRIQQAQGKPIAQVSALVVNTIERADELALPSLQALVALTGLEYDLLVSTSGRPSSSALASFPAPRPLALWDRLDDVERAVNQLADTVPTVSLGGGNAGRTLGNLMMNMHPAGGAVGGNNAASAGSNPTRVGGMKWKQSADSVLQTLWSLQGKSTLAASLGWRMVGKRAVAAAFDDVFWVAYRESASAREIALWLARMVLNQATTRSKELDPPTESFNVAFADALNHLHDLMHAQRIPNHDLLMYPSLQRALHQVFFSWSLNRGEHAMNDFHIHQIIALSPASSNYPTYLTALLMQAQGWGEREQYEHCFQQLDELETICDDRGYEYLLAQVLINRSRYRQRSAIGQHGPFDALPDLLRAIGICQTHSFELLLAEAHVIMAEIYLAMAKINDALQLIHEQRAFVNEHGSIQLLAESLLLEAKIALAIPFDSPEEEEDEDDKDTRLQRCLELIRESETLWQTLQHWKKLREIAFLKATIHRQQRSVVFDREASNAAAKAFFEYEKLLREAQGREIESGFKLSTLAQLDRVVQSRMQTCI